MASQGKFKNERTLHQNIEWNKPFGHKTRRGWLKSIEDMKLRCGKYTMQGVLYTPLAWFHVL